MISLHVSPQIIGSSTICVATIDVSSNQLSYTNIGDGGLMVVRHVPRDGTLNAKVAPTTHTLNTRYNDVNYKIAYLAQQQLRSFNFPFQLGNGGTEHEVILLSCCCCYCPYPTHIRISSLDLIAHVCFMLGGVVMCWVLVLLCSQGVFEQPMDADTGSIPLMPGDVVVMASDGLFDNLEISEIIAIISEWEHPVEGEQQQVMGEASWAQLAVNSSHDDRCEALAKSLVLAAREASLSKDKDR